MDREEIFHVREQYVSRRQGQIQGTERNSVLLEH